MENPFKNYKPVNAKSEREEQLKILYSLYSESWKRNTLKSYNKWRKQLPDTKENKAKFRKTKLFFRKTSQRTLAIRLAIAKTSLQDLYWLNSIGRDMLNRKQNYARYLMGRLKVKNK